MKLVVFSDSHGSIESMLAAVQREQPHALLHLGDCTVDAARLFSLFPAIPGYAVAGNAPADLLSGYPLRLTCKLGTVACLLVHGHVQHVKSGTQWLVAAAQASSAQIAFFGHTHTPFSMQTEGVLLFNPGSISRGVYGENTYGVVTLKPNGRILCRHVPSPAR